MKPPAFGPYMLLVFEAKYAGEELQVTFQFCFRRSETGLSARQERAQQLGKAEVLMQLYQQKLELKSLFATFICDLIPECAVAIILRSVFILAFVTP